MEESDSMKALKKALSEDPEVVKKFDEAVSRILEEKKAGSDGELFSMAAKELGFDIPASEFEVSTANEEELDPEELEVVSGGEFCMTVSERNFGSMRDDESGHNSWCLAAWHCYTGMIHTEGGGNSVACYSDFQCLMYEHEGPNFSYRSHCLIDNVKDSD